MKVYVVGGFLGSGKTTAIHEACLELMKRQVTTAVITNDQGENLVDTKFLSASDIHTGEVVNGCFCCNYTQLEDRIGFLQQEVKPDIVFAESVGSCTDLIATVVKPLLHFHPELEVVVSVVVDVRLLPIQLFGSRLFSGNINYIYRKQLDEADILVVNKVDLVSPDELNNVRQLLKKEYPGKPVLFQNSHESASVQRWLDVLASFPIKEREALDLDYAIYGAGETELAWLDADVRVVSMERSASSVVSNLISDLYQSISMEGIPIGHLKFLINDGKTKTKVSFTSVSDSHVRKQFLSDSNEISVLINARVKSEPTVLKNIFDKAVEKGRRTGDVVLTVKALASFKPGIPIPLHRFQ